MTYNFLDYVYVAYLLHFLIFMLVYQFLSKYISSQHGKQLYMAVWRNFIVSVLTPLMLSDDVDLLIISYRVDDLMIY